VKATKLVHGTVVLFIAMLWTAAPARAASDATTWVTSYGATYVPALQPAADTFARGGSTSTNSVSGYQIISADYSFGAASPDEALDSLGIPPNGGNFVAAAVIQVDGTFNAAVVLAMRVPVLASPSTQPVNVGQTPTSTQIPQSAVQPSGSNTTSSAVDTTSTDLPRDQVLPDVSGQGIGSSVQTSTSTTIGVSGNNALTEQPISKMSTSPDSHDNLLGALACGFAFGIVCSALRRRAR
jgi:hypothetical protein